jgi:predicted TIM-barrel fold metal-dependent hydrolase
VIQLTRRFVLEGLALRLALCRSMFLRRATKLPRRYFVVLALFLGACATRQPPQMVELPSTGPDGELVTNVPVVDIHTHTFNARFLPVRNLLLGKRRDKHWAGFFVRPPFVIAVANKIARHTKLEGLSSASASGPQLMHDAAVEANNLSAQLERPTRGVTAAKLQKHPSVTGIQKIAEGMAGEDLSNAELRHLKVIVSMLAAEERVPADKAERKSEIGHFLRCLLASDAELVEKFHTDHGKSVKLMVSHMMDLEPVFNQEVDDERLLLPFDEQIARVKKQQDNAGGRMLYFVAYNPFRDHYRGGRPGDALAVVKKAYEKQDAFGVKIYPPSGYIPFENNIPPPPRRPKWTQPWKQWNARYQPGGVLLTRKQMDDRLLELFRWAVDQDVPLFVHTGDNEVEASKNYAKMANPAHWLALLDKHKELENIRICFGHAGDSEYWFGPKRKGWGEDVYKLCTKYPNIYCEFGVHDSIVYPEERQNFSARLAELIAESRTDSEKFDFSTKILYGSDWFMPMMAGRDRVNYLNAHKHAILKVPLKPVDGEANPVDTERLYKNYFYRNAMAFLKAEKQLSRGGIPKSLRDKLQSLVDLTGTEDARFRTRGAGAKLRARTDPGQRRSQEDFASSGR